MFYVQIKGGGKSWFLSVVYLRGKIRVQKFKYFQLKNFQLKNSADYVYQKSQSRNFQTITQYPREMNFNATVRERNQFIMQKTLCAPC